MLSLALAGKPNVGKSTFFRAATLAEAEIANYPFTTKDANHGVAKLRVPCVCRELKVEGCGCDGGTREIPLELVDVAGLVPGAHRGRGLGNQFLYHLRRSEAIVEVVDASGGTDAEGNPVGAGSRDPLEDIRMLEEELGLWLAGLVEKHWRNYLRRSGEGGEKPERVLA
ncbi:MAG: 50S ribosome-binding GTPase, partial [Euryarchaeota archaeon]|nr:50S ribosome-binding GTPase [Euryarchaeota archaeon]